MTNLPQVLIWLAERSAARPRSVVAAAVLLAGAALVLTLQQLRIDTDTQEMISPDVPFRQNEAAFLAAFPAFDETVVAVIEGHAPELVEQAAQALADALRADDEHFTAVEYPAGEAFFDRHGLLYLPVDQLAELTDRLAGAQPLLAALADDPSLHGLAEFLALTVERGPGDSGPPPEIDRMLGAMARTVEAQLDGEERVFSWRRALDDVEEAPLSRALIVAEPVLDFSSMAPAADAISALLDRAAALGITTEQGLDLGLTGEAVLDTEELESVGSGALLAATITTLAVATLLIVGLRSLRLIAATLLTLAVGLVLTAGFAALTIGRLNLISITFAVLFVGLGVDFGIHLVLRFQEALDGLARTGEDRYVPALRAATAGVGGPLSLSALCAGLGFLAFVPTDYRGLAELGIISAAGMAIAWLSSFTLLPALLAILCPRSKPQRFERLSAGPLRPVRPRLVVGSALLAGFLSLAAVPAVTFDFNPLNLKDPESGSMRTFARLAKDPELSPHIIDVLAPTLDQADALAARLEALPSVGQAATLTDFVPDAQEEKLELIEPLAFYLGPALAPGDRADREEAASPRAGFERLRAVLEQVPSAGAGATRLAEALAAFGPEPPDEALDELEHRLTGTLPGLLERLRRSLDAAAVDFSDLPARLREQWVNEKGRARIAVRPALPITDNAELAAFTRAVLSVAPKATGTPVVVLESGEEVVQAFYQASALAFAVIAVLLVLVLRTVRDLALVLVPLALAILLTAASAVLLGLQLNFANVIVLPLLLGLGVSGAVHVVMRWREEGRFARVATTSTPRAVLFSALTTVASFGSLAVSAHRGLASMGLLLVIAIFWSLICNLVVLPNLLALASARDE